MNGAPRWETPQESARTQTKDTTDDQEQLPLHAAEPVERYVRRFALAGQDAGVERARTADPEGMAAALEAIETLCAGGTHWTADDVRELSGVSGPVLGSAVRAANRRGLIVPVGVTTARSVKAHGRIQRVWTGAGVTP